MIAGSKEGSFAWHMRRFYDAYNGPKCSFDKFYQRAYRGTLDDDLEDLISPKRKAGRPPSAAEAYYRAYEGPKCERTTYLGRLRRGEPKETAISPQNRQHIIASQRRVESLDRQAKEDLTPYRPVLQLPRRIEL
jgi:hypothetical protein